MVFNNSILLGAAGQSGAGAVFDTTLIGNSIWLDGSADNLTKSFGSGADQQEFVLAAWVQRNSFGSLQFFFGSGTSGRQFGLGFTASDELELRDFDSPINARYITNALFRDIGWYHVLTSIKTSESVANNRVKIFVNGSEITSFSTETNPSLNFDMNWGISGDTHAVGSFFEGSASNFFKGYITQAVYISGKSIQGGDFTISDFLDTFTFGTNGSQFIPKKDSDIASLATGGGATSFCLNFSTASVALSSGITPTSNAGTFSGSLSNLTDGNFTTEWRSNVDPATNVDNDHVAFDLGSAKDVKAVKVTGRSSITGNFKVQFSDNGSDFTDTGTTFSNVSITSTANSGILDLTSDNPGSHRYWKLINISNSSGTSAWGFKQIILASAVGNLGTDASGKGNDFTLTSIDSNNQSENTSSKVYPVWNPLARVGSGSVTLSEGNTKAAVVDNGGIVMSQTLPFSGLWYWEVNTADTTFPGLGLAQQSAVGYTGTGVWANTTADTHIYQPHAGNVNNNGTLTAGYSAAQSGAVRYAVAWDGDNRAIYFGSISGSTISWFNSGDPTSGSSKTGAMPTTGLPTSGSEPVYFLTVDLGGASTQTLIMDEDDWTGSTNRPAAAKALNSENLTAPDYQGIDYFDTTLYEGNGTGQRVGDFVPVTDVGTITRSFLCDGHTNSGTTDLTISTGISTAPTNTQIKTLSFWIKPVSVREQHVYNASTDATDSTDSSERIYIATNGEVAYQTRQNGSAVAIAYTAGAGINDASQWFNVVVALNYDSSTAAANTLKIYVDGVEQTLFSGADGTGTAGGTLPAPGMTAQAYINKASTRQLIGTHPGFTSANSRSNCYLAEMYMVDGQALDASAFGVLDTSTNRWVPKAPATIKSTITGTGAGFGGCGFYLDFLDASDLGDDDSGNNRDFTESATIGTENQVADSPSINFDNLGGAQVGGTISEGNTKAALGTGGNQIRSNFKLKTGKWYVESDIQATNNSASIGLVPSESSTWSNGPGRDADGGISYETDGDVFSDNVQNATAEASFAAGDVIQMAIDMDAKKVYFGKNNTFGGNPAAGTGGHFLPASILSDGAALITLGNYSGSQSSTQQINYGQLLVFDGGSTTNGFKYTPPTGFQAVNQDNLDDTASKLTAWAWIKNRDASSDHMLFDRVRGVGKDLHSNSTDAEATDANTVQRFLQRGVQVGNDSTVNTSGNSFVLWQWLVGDSATTGTVIPADNPPSIASTVITADAGHFSVGTFTGAGGSSTIGHGLSAAPEFFLVKRIGTSGTGWFIYSKDTTDPNNKFLRLQGTNIEDSASGAWTPGATTMGLNESSLNGINTSGVEHLFIAFRSVPGVCKVGKYTTNNIGDNGPYISLGFKPRWIMFKSITVSTSQWTIYDAVKEPFNVGDHIFQYANLQSSDQAFASNDIDMLSDGIKIRSDAGFEPNDAGEFLYLAMADIAGGGRLPPIYGR